jgi:2'-5' RNA ligase
MTALVLPIYEIEPFVRDVARRFARKSVIGFDPDDTLAHVTLIVPFLPPDRVTPSVEQDLEEIFSRAEPPEFRLTGACGFPGGFVYLAVDSPYSIVGLVRSIVARWPEAPPYGGRHSDLVPHVTVWDDPDGRVPDEVLRIVSHLQPVRVVAREVELVSLTPPSWTVLRRFRIGSELAEEPATLPSEASA